jgi:glutamate racemase
MEPLQGPGIFDRIEGKKAGEMMYSPEDYIAVFDSGVGGVSVLRQLRRVLPCERYIYFGDSANAPYGSKTTEKVRELSFAVAERLRREYPVKALVVACNTATAAAIRELREAFPDLIVIGIEPALKLAADSCPGGHIGVMATQVTLREEKFDALLHRFRDACTVYKIPAPGLVELVEAGKADGPEMDAFLETLLGPYRGKLNALVLGCTHYPFASKSITRILGTGTILLDGGEGTARETKRRLEAAGLLRQGEGSVEFISSARDERTVTLAKKLLSQ